MKNNFFKQFDILVPNYSEKDDFLKMKQILVLTITENN